VGRLIHEFLYLKSRTKKNTHIKQRTTASSLIPSHGFHLEIDLVRLVRCAEKKAAEHKSKWSADSPIYFPGPTLDCSTLAAATGLCDCSAAFSHVE